MMDEGLERIERELNLLRDQLLRTEQRDAALLVEQTRLTRWNAVYCAYAGQETEQEIEDSHEFAVAMADKVWGKR